MPCEGITCGSFFDLPFSGVFKKLLIESIILTACAKMKLSVCIITYNFRMAPTVQSDVPKLLNVIQ